MAPSRRSIVLFGRASAQVGFAWMDEQQQQARASWAELGHADAAGGAGSGAPNTIARLKALAMQRRRLSFGPGSSSSSSILHGHAPPSLHPAPTSPTRHGSAGASASALEAQGARVPVRASMPALRPQQGRYAPQAHHDADVQRGGADGFASPNRDQIVREVRHAARGATPPNAVHLSLDQCRLPVPSSPTVQITRYEMLMRVKQQQQQHRSKAHLLAPAGAANDDDWRRDAPPGAGGRQPDQRPAAAAAPSHGVRSSASAAPASRAWEPHAAAARSGQPTRHSTPSMAAGQQQQPQQPLDHIIRDVAARIIQAHWRASRQGRGGGSSAWAQRRASHDAGDMGGRGAQVGACCGAGADVPCVKRNHAALPPSTPTPRGGP